MTAPAVVLRVDTALVAPARPRDTREVWALGNDGHAVVRQQKDNAGRRRPGVGVGARVYRAPLHVHRLDAVAVEFIRAAVQHGRGALLRLDIAADIGCASQQAADTLHRQLRERVFLVGGRGSVRVSHATGTNPGTSYIGAPKDEETAEQGEGATLVIYSDAPYAGRKNGGRPTCHVELRLFGARVVRAAVGRGLDIEKAWRRVRMVEDLSRAGCGIRRLASRGGGVPYAQDVHEEMRLLDIDRRPVFGRAVPFLAWARRNPARRAVSRDDATAQAQSTRSPQATNGADPRLLYDRIGSSLSSSTPPSMRLRFRPNTPRHRFHTPPVFRYRPRNTDKE